MKFENTSGISRIATAVFVQKGAGTPIHRNRPFDGIAYEVDGAALYKFETGEELLCEAGQCIYLPKDSNYVVTRHSKDHGGVYCINFLFEGIEEREAPFTVKVRAADEIKNAFTRAEYHWNRKEVGYYEECLICLLKIIKLIKQQTAVYAPLGHARELLSPAVELLNSNSSDKGMSVPELAARCGISETYFRRLFGRVFGVSPTVYSRNRRIEYAKELLTSGEYSIAEIAELSGFVSPSYFSREFKKTVGVSPSEYL